MKKLTPAGIGALTLAAALALAPPAQAGGISLQDFIDTHCVGTTPIGADESVQVDDEEAVLGTAVCSVTLGDNSRLDFGKKITFTVDGVFTLDGSGGDHVTIQFGEGNIITTLGIDWSVGEVGEIRVKKLSDIIANSDIDMTAAGDDSTIQIEEDVCLDASGDISLTATGEHSEIQIKQGGDSCGFGSPDFIDVIAGGSITISSDVEDGDVLIGEKIKMLAECGNITLNANEENGEVKTNKEVELTAVHDAISCPGGGNILLVAGEDGNVLVEEDNDFDADVDITVESGDGGKTEIKKGTDLDAGTGAGDTITVSSGGECKIEADTVGEWTAGPGGGDIDTDDCELTF